VTEKRLSVLYQAPLFQYETKVLGIRFTNSLSFITKSNMTDEEKKAKTDEVSSPDAEASREETTDAAPAEEAKEEAPVVEKKAEEAAQSSVEEEEVEVPKEFKKIIEDIEKMTVLELHSFVKVLEKKFGVSATAVAVAGGGGGEAPEEKDEFTVELASIGDSKIGVIKVVKEILGLGLKEAKDLVESAPAVLKEGVKKEEAEEWKTKIEGAGGIANLK
jgi:large subunit ribosomal protein L7/L12